MATFPNYGMAHYDTHRIDVHVELLHQVKDDHAQLDLNSIIQLPYTQSPRGHQELE